MSAHAAGRRASLGPGGGVTVWWAGLGLVVAVLANRRSRRLLLTTKTELNAMAAPAIKG